MTDQCRVVEGEVLICGHLGLPRNRGFLCRWVCLPEWWSLWCMAFAPLLVGFSNPHLHRNSFSTKFPDFQCRSSLLKCHWILNYAKDARKEGVLPTPPLQMRTQRSRNVRDLSTHTGLWSGKTQGPRTTIALTLARDPGASSTPAIHAQWWELSEPCRHHQCLCSTKAGTALHVFQKKANGELGKFD